MLTYHGLQDVHFHLIFHFLMLHATSHQKKASLPANPKHKGSAGRLDVTFREVN